MNYGMVTIPGRLEHTTNNECNKLQREFGYYATWDKTKFINRGGNGDSDSRAGY